MYLLAGASIASAIFLTTLYGLYAPFHSQEAVAVTAPHIELDPALITAKAAIIFDPNSGQILFEKNAHAQLPLASLTKLMSADAILSSGVENAVVSISVENLKPEGDSGLRVGENWKLEDLLMLGLVASSNDAMAAAANALGGDVTQRMNMRAQELGLSQTHFSNATGLDLDLEIAGAYGSAYDVAKLAANFLRSYPGLFETTAHQRIGVSSNSQYIEATSTAAPLLDIPGLIAAKTGYTDLAGGNLVAAVDVKLGRPLIIAVLGSTRQARFLDVKTLVHAARATLLEQP